MKNVRSFLAVTVGAFALTTGLPGSPAHAMDPTPVGEKCTGGTPCSTASNGLACVSPGRTCKKIEGCSGTAPSGQSGDCFLP